MCHLAKFSSYTNWNPLLTSKYSLVIGVPAARQTERHSFNFVNRFLKFQVTLNMLNAASENEDADDLVGDVKLEFESANDEVAT